MPGIAVSISSEVSPQMREFERFNTVCANAYVKPLIKSYLDRLRRSLQDIGVDCPVFMMHSGGGIISVETAAEFPVRLVESGPAGGAIFAADIARRHGLDAVLSFDMGGTTAKICLIEDQVPKTATTVRGRADLPVSKGQRHADLDPGGRDGRDRRRRRLDRRRRRAAPDPGRARRAPARSPAPPATSAAARCRPSPMPTSCSAGSTPTISPAAASRCRRRAPTAALDAAIGASLGIDADHRRLRHLRGGRREHGQCRPRPRRRERQGNLAISR